MKRKSNKNGFTGCAKAYIRNLQEEGRYSHGNKVGCKFRNGKIFADLVQQRLVVIQVSYGKCCNDRQGPQQACRDTLVFFKRIIHGTKVGNFCEIGNSLYPVRL